MSKVINMNALKEARVRTVEIPEVELSALRVTVAALAKMHLELIRLYEEESHLKKHHKAYLHIRDHADQVCKEDKEKVNAMLQQFIADGMGIPLSEVCGVISFYSFFSTQKRGKHTIRMCQGTACYVRGGKKLVDAIHENLGVETNGTTEDGQFTFEIARCIGACGIAPAVSINGKVYPKMTVSQVREVIAQQYLIVEKEKEAANA